MNRPHSLVTFVSLILATFAPTTILYGQSTKSAKVDPAIVAKIRTIREGNHVTLVPPHVWHHFRGPNDHAGTAIVSLMDKTMPMPFYGARLILSGPVSKMCGECWDLPPGTYEIAVTAGPGETPFYGGSQTFSADMEYDFTINRPNVKRVP